MSLHQLVDEACLERVRRVHACGAADQAKDRACLPHLRAIAESEGGELTPGGCWLGGRPVGEADAFVLPGLTGDRKGQTDRFAATREPEAARGSAADQPWEKRDRERVSERRKMQREEGGSGGVVVGAE